MRKYFQRFKLVEIQRTFYSLPKPETAKKWRELAPKDFEFTAKAWQLITHPPSSPTYRRAKIEIGEEKRENYGYFKPTKEVNEAWRRTREAIDALEATVVVFQCPSSFKSTEENISNLRNFFSTIERGAHRCAWEPRGEWDSELVRELCEELNLIHCVDPLFQEPTTGGEIAYLRLHGARRDGRIDYKYKYTEADLERLAGICRELLRVNEEVYCLFNNASMLDDARRFREILSRQGL